MKHLQIKTIISGGQTGADRAAFDFALENKIEIGGFVPKNRRAEDGRISDKYPNLIETPTGNYAERTALNVQTADATLILSHQKLKGGSLLTKKAAGRYQKPVLHINLAEREIGEAVEQALDWLASIKCEKLNVAGPRASTDPEIYEKTKIFLKKLFAAKKDGAGKAPSASQRKRY